jgi:Flp pilus assembly protein TadB
MRESSKTEKRIQLECQGRAPELIGYMAMSIRLSPSLTRAITFAARNMDGPIGSGLKRILWNVYTRKFHSVEEPFTATATEWGKQNEDLKRALFALRSATLEATDEGRERSLDKAMDIVISGTKKKMEEFASSLSTPTTVLFALGILLPMILGAMLPMVSLGGLDLSYRAEGSGTSGGIHPLLVVLLMDVVFPLAAFLYAFHILSGRPGVVGSIQFERRSDPWRWTALLFVVLGASLGVFGVLNLNTFGPYLIIWSTVLPVSIRLISKTHRMRKKTGETLRMEEEFPDVLFQLGTRISEGAPPEKAVMETARSLKDTSFGDLLHMAQHRMIVFDHTLERTFFGEAGLFAGFPSRRIRATMRSFVEIAKKDSVKAGQMVISTSDHLQEIQRLDEDTRRSLRTSTESMRMTSLLFAPIVMGVTFSLYSLLYKTFIAMGQTESMMSPSIFLIVLGVYVVLIAVVATYFVTAIQKGPDRTERDYSIGIGILVSVFAYTIACLVGQTLLT